MIEHVVIIIFILYAITVWIILYVSADYQPDADERIIRQQENEISRLRHRIDELEKKQGLRNWKTQ